MEDQDERPPQYPEDGADDHGYYVDGDVVREEQVRQEEEDQTNDGVTYKRAHAFPLFLLPRPGSLKRSLSSVSYEKKAGAPIRDTGPPVDIDMGALAPAAGLYDDVQDRKS